MDDKWFKAKQKAAGVTAEEIAQKMGRDRSIVSRIYNGHQKMSLEWARAFADVLKVPLDQVLKHAGALDAQQAQTVAPGFSESDAAPWAGEFKDHGRIKRVAAIFGAEDTGIDVWTVRSTALALNGFMVGDYLVVDTTKSENCKAGDFVVAQIYDWQTGTATTVLRRFEPPVLVAGSLDPDEQRVHVVDGKNVVIKGKITASWRA